VRVGWSSVRAAARTLLQPNSEMLAFTLLLRFQITDLRVLQLRSVVHTYFQHATMTLLHLPIS